ncbi:hypothetical protein Tco_1349744, partial [Tanacetum coccineum]
MDIIRVQQIALDDALVAHANRLMIGKNNLRLSSNLKSKEPTLQVVYDVLKLTPFYKAFQIIVDVPEIYMQEFWATAIVHHHSIRFKMNNKKHIRSFDAVINKCLSGKSTGYDSLRLSQAQILWGMYNKKNVDFAYLLWEDFVNQVETKNAKKGNEMYYPRFTKVIVNFFMTKDQSIPRTNRVNWHFTRDDPMFTMIKTVSRHEDTHLYGAILLDELTNEAIKDSESYKEYCEGTGGKPRVPDVPTYGSDDEQISWKSSDEENDDEVGMSDDDDDNDDDDDDADNQDNDGQDDDGQEYDGQDNEGQDDDNKQTDSDNDGDDFVHPKVSTQDQEERQDEEDNEEEGEELNEETDEEEEVNELYRDVNVNLEGRDTEMTDAQQTNDQGTHIIEDTHVIMTAAAPEVQQQSSSVSSSFISNMLNPNPDTGIDSIINLNTESTSLVDVPVTKNVEMPPSSFEDRVKALEDDFSKFKQANQFATAFASIPGIVDTYLANKMNEAVKIVVQLQSDKLRTEAQADNEDFINKIDENMKKIIKEQVKVQLKEQVSKILPKIEKFVNDQLEAEVLTRSSNQAAANLSELELKKILIDKMENNKSIDRSIQQKTLYNALVDAYETDKDILETYGDTVMFKRRRDDEDKDEEPSTRSNQGSKRRIAGKEPESTSAPKEKTSKSSGKTKEGSKSHHTSTGKSAQAEEPIHANED